MRRTPRVWAAVAALLLTMVAEVGLSTRQESPSWDEGDHIYSGYMNWKHREYSLNPEHPPLVELVAALPLLGLDLKIAPRQGRYSKADLGDFSLPEADAVGYWHRSNDLLAKDPRTAFEAARQATALVPDGFDANPALGDATAALGMKPEARAAYVAAQRCVDDMEPSSQTQWQPQIVKKLSSVE